MRPINDLHNMLRDWSSMHSSPMDLIFNCIIDLLLFYFIEQSS